jgi:hypothetical protein
MKAPNSKKARSYEGLKSLEDFLDEEGIREEVTARATKRVMAIVGDGLSPTALGRALTRLPT